MDFGRWVHGQTQEPVGSINPVFIRPVVKMPDTSTPEESRMELSSVFGYRPPGEGTCQSIGQPSIYRDYRSLNRTNSESRGRVCCVRWIFLNSRNRMDKNDLSLFPSRVERCNRHKFKVSVIFFSSCIYSINIWDIGLKLLV